MEEEDEEEEKKRYGSLCICDFEYGKSMICMGYMEVFVWNYVWNSMKLVWNLCMELGFCMETLSMEVFVWILVVPFLGFS